MAPSLQELIAFLLNEVALCGNQGAYSSASQTHFTQHGSILFPDWHRSIEPPQSL